MVGTCATRWWRWARPPTPGARSSPRTATDRPTSRRSSSATAPAGATIRCGARTSRSTASRATRSASPAPGRGGSGGSSTGVNDAGVVAGNETIYTTLDPADAPPALIGMDLVRLGLERATQRRRVGRRRHRAARALRPGRQRAPRRRPPVLVVVPRRRSRRRRRGRDVGPAVGGECGRRAPAPSATARRSRPSTPRTAIRGNPSSGSSIPAWEASKRCWPSSR